MQITYRKILVIFCVGFFMICNVLANSIDLPKSCLSPNDPYKVKIRSFYKGRPDNPPNIIDNSSFEVGMKNWQVAGYGFIHRTKWSIDRNDSIHGENSLKISRPGNVSTKVCVWSAPVNVDKAKKYILSAYIKSSKPTTVKLAEKAFKISEEWKRCIVDLGKIKEPYYHVSIEHLGNETIWLDGIQLEKKKLTEYKFPESVEIGVSSNKTANIFSLNEPIIISINVFNGKKEQVELHLSGVLFDFKNTIVSRKEINLTLNGNEGKIFKIKQISQKGYFKFHFKLTGENIKSKECEISWGTIVPLKNKDNSKKYFWGACSLSIGPNIDWLCELWEKAGAGNIEIYGPFYWSYAPCDWQTDKKYLLEKDEMLSVLEKYNMTPIGHLFGVPEWAGPNKRPKQESEITAEMLNGWSKYTFDVADRYKNSVPYWDVWTEFIRGPINNYSAMYMKFLESAYIAIKKANPKAVVTGFGVSKAKTIFQFEKQFSLGALKYVDVVGWHPYAWPACSPEEVAFSEKLDSLKEMIKKYNNGKEKDVWITEVGWLGSNYFYNDFPSSGVDYDPRRYNIYCTELAQAENIVRMHLISLAKGVKKFFTFSFSPSTIYNPSPFALLNYDLSPKVAYVAYNNMVCMLKDAKFVVKENLWKNVVCYMFKTKSNEELAVVWNCDPEKKALNLKLPHINATLINMVGTEKNILKTQEEDLQIELTGSPVYIKSRDDIFKALKNAKIEEKNIKVKSSFVANNKLCVELGNNTGHQLTGEIVLESPENWKIFPSTSSFSLKNGEKKHCSFIFEKMTFPLNKGAEINVTVNESSKTVFFKKFKLLPAYYTDKEMTIDGDIFDWSDFLPCIKLEASSLKSLNKQSEWGGCNDLSAVLYAAWDEKYIYLMVEVNDSVLSFPHSGNMIWANDALQVGFDTLDNASGKSDYDNDDYEFTFSLTKFDVPKMFLYNPQFPYGQDNDIKFSIKKKKAGLSYELAIPFSSLAPFRLSLGSIAFNIAIIDNDSNAASINNEPHQYLELFPGICRGKQPSLFGNLLLIQSNPSQKLQHGNERTQNRGALQNEKKH